MMKKNVLLILFTLLINAAGVAQVTVGAGTTYNLPAGNYTSVTVNGGTLNITGPNLNVSIGNLFIHGASNNMGIVNISGSQVNVNVTYMEMSTLNTRLSVTNTSGLTIGSHTVGSVSPNTCQIRVEAGASLLALSGLNVGNGTDLKITNAVINTQQINMNASVFEASGINTLVNCSQINFSSSSDFRIKSGATVTTSADVNCQGSNLTRLEMLSNAKLNVGGNFNISGGKFFSDASSNVTVSGNLNNNIGLDFFPSNEKMNLIMNSSSDQLINGPCRLGLLSISGSNGKVTLHNTVEVTSLLQLFDRVLEVNGTLDITNTSPSAVARQGSGYVNSLYDDNTTRFIRRTNSNSEYFFPVGTATIYRPVYIRPASSAPGAYSARCVGHAPYIGLGNVGSSVIQADIASGNGNPARKRINSLYHHEIRDQLANDASPSAAIYIGYDVVADGSAFDAIAQYLSGAWQALQVPVSRNPEGNISYAGVSSYETSASNVAYVLVNSTESTVPPSYVRLRHKLDGGHYKANANTIYFLFEEEYAIASSQLNYKVYNSTNTVVMNSSPSLPVSQGLNKYSLNLGSIASGAYVLEVINSKNEKWYLRFQK